MLMVTIYGSSGCTAEIVQHLRRMGLQDIGTYPEVIRFSREYAQPLPALQEREEQHLRGEIAGFEEQEARHAKLLALKAAEREALLLKEREGIPAQIDARAGPTRNPFVALWRLLARVRLRRRLRALTDHLPREAAKPFKGDRRKIGKIQKNRAYLETHFVPIVAKRLKAGIRGKQYLNANRPLVVGAAGEEAVINELRQLPDPFIVFNDLRFAYRRSVYWRQGGEYVRSCQVDHLVIGPGGVYLLETKNWRASRVVSNGGWTPEHQIERANFLFYLVTHGRFRFKLPTRSLVVMVQGGPVTRSRFVTRLPLNTLVPHLLRAQPCLRIDEIYTIAKWFLKKQS